MSLDDCLSAFRSGSIDTVDKWDDLVSSGKLDGDQQLELIVACATTAPSSHAMLLTAVFKRWRTGHSIVPVKKLSTGKVEVAGQEPDPHTIVKFGINDFLHLRAKTAEAESLLHRFGVWWRFNRAFRDGKECFLTSIGKQKRSESPKKVHEFIIGRKGDWQYDVINIIPFPCDETKIPKEYR